MRAVVIGAGLAGLAAADELHRAGVDIEVIEARDRVGGRVLSESFGDDTIERGAEFILPGSPDTRSTAERLGLRLARKGLSYGDRNPVSPEPVTLSEVRATAQRLQTLQWPDRESVDRVLASVDLRAPAREAIRARMEVSCAYPANDLDATVMREGGTDFGDFDTHSIEGGNDRLAAALAEQIESRRIHLGTAASHITHGCNEVQIRAGDFEITADAAVVAVPASVIDAISFEPPLPPAKAAAYRAVRYGQAAKLFVALSEPAAPSATLSVPQRFWCYTQLRPDGCPARFVAAFAGTDRALGALGVANGGRPWLRALAALRPDLKLDPGTVRMSTWSDDPWVKGAYSAPSSSSPIDQAELARPIGRLVFAGEHTAGDMHATMEGALRSGLRAARELVTLV